MATQLTLRKGTKIQNDAFTGAEGELTYVSDTKGLRIHDGSTQGGIDVDVVVVFIKPTAENNYTWARKYASGWVEQGGTMSARSSNSSVTAIFPIQMADSNYSVNSITVYASGGTDVANQITARTTTSVSIYDWSGRETIWEVKGMAA